MRALEPQFCANSSTNPFLILPHRTHLCLSCSPLLTLSFSLRLPFDLLVPSPKSLIEYPRVLRREWLHARSSLHAWTPDAHEYTGASERFWLQQTLPVESVRMRIARPLSFVIRVWEDRGTSCLRHTVNFASTSQPDRFGVRTSAIYVLRYAASRR